MQQTTLEISSVQEIIENSIIRVNSIIGKMLANGNMSIDALRTEYARSILLGDLKKNLFKGESHHDFSRISKNLQVFLNNESRLIDNIICPNIELGYCSNKQLMSEIIDAVNVIPCETLQNKDDIDQILRALTNRINTPKYSPTKNVPVVVKPIIDVETYCCKSKKK